MRQALPFVLLWLATLALWLQPPATRPPPHLPWHVRPGAWAIAWLLAVGTAAWAGLLDAGGTTALVTCIGLAAWWRGAADRHASTRLGALAPWVFGALSLALALHLVPGIHNPLVLDGVRWRPGDAPYSLRASFDKGCAALLLLATVVPRCPSPPPTQSLGAPVGVAALLSTVTALGLGWAWGLTEPAQGWPAVPGQPQAVATFLALNLLVTCLAEEAFFRGLLQSALMKRWGGRGAVGRVAAIALPATLFGLVHLGGGLRMVALAAIVGLGSGWAFARTRRIEAAVLVHFTVNAVHLLAFTYPARMG